MTWLDKVASVACVFWLEPQPALTSVLGLELRASAAAQSSHEPLDGSAGQQPVTWKTVLKPSTGRGSRTHECGRDSSLS